MNAAIILVAAFSLNTGDLTYTTCMDLTLTLVVIMIVVALNHLISRKDISGDDKILWALAILFLNGVGVLLYILFGPRRDSRTDPQHPDSTLRDGAKEIRLENSSWNPIIGQNDWGAGKSLNPKWDDKRGIDLSADSDAPTDPGKETP